MPEKNGDFLELTLKIMRENEEFLKNNMKYVIDDFVELINDAIDCVFLFTKSENSMKLYVRQALAFYVYHILMPTSYSLFVNLLTGNIPACFRELRFMLESLAKSYLADLRYMDKSFFQDKLDALSDEKTKDGRKKREHQFISEFGSELGLGKRPISLWGKLSNESHMRRYVERVVGNISEKSDVPSYALLVPMSYKETDVEDLGEIRNYIIEFSEILKTAINVQNSV